MARRYDSLDSKRRILSACVRLFIEKGYHNTRMADIISNADVSASTFQNIFHAKDGVLKEVARFIFGSQFDFARDFVNPSADPLTLFTFDTAIILTLAEIDENIREIYVEAYTNEESAEYIYQQTSSELYRTFSPYLPGYSESDFYELDIGTTGIIRGYMARRCDKYFNLEKKLTRCLKMTLSGLSVPEEDQNRVIEAVLATDLKPVAKKARKKLFTELAKSFDFELDPQLVK